MMHAPNRFKPTTSPSALVLQGKEVQFELGLIGLLTTSQSKGMISKSIRNTISFLQWRNNNNLWSLKSKKEINHI